jgi:hypothetical protein
LLVQHQQNQACQSKGHQDCPSLGASIDLTCTPPDTCHLTVNGMEEGFMRVKLSSRCNACKHCWPECWVDYHPERGGLQKYAIVMVTFGCHILFLKIVVL